MKINRQALLIGVENEFPEELRPQVRRLLNRIDQEFENIFNIFRNDWAMTNDSEIVCVTPQGERIYVEYPDGTQEAVVVDFGQDTSNL